MAALSLQISSEELEEMLRRVVREEVEHLRHELGGDLTTDQAAEVAGVGAKTIREWVATGRIVASRRGRQIRIPRAELDRAIRGDTPDPREAAEESLRALRARG